MPDNILDPSEEALAAGKPNRDFWCSLIMYSSMLLAYRVVQQGVLELISRFNLYYEGESDIVGIITLIALVLFHIVLLIIALKRYSMQTPAPAFFSMLLLGMAICGLAIILYQAGRHLMHMYNSGFKEFLIVSLIVAAFGLVISFFITFQLKTRKTTWTVAMVIAFLAVGGYLADHYKVFE